jgi:hypothetical protein
MPHLDVRLDDVKHKVPVRARPILYDRCEDDEELGQRGVDVVIQVRPAVVVLGREPLLQRLQEEDGALLREEEGVGVDGRGDSDEEAKEGGAGRPSLGGGDGGERAGELILIALEARRLEEPIADAVDDGDGNAWVYASAS